MIKAGTMCIMVRSQHGQHTGHICQTTSDSFEGFTRCPCGCGDPGTWGVMNHIRCCNEIIYTCPTAWLRPLPPLTEDESTKNEMVVT